MAEIALTLLVVAAVYIWGVVALDFMLEDRHGAA